jgi:hypothetical protein
MARKALLNPPDGPHRKRVAAWWFTVGPTHSGIGDLTV